MRAGDLRRRGRYRWRRVVDVAAKVEQEYPGRRAVLLAAFVATVWMVGTFLDRSARALPMEDAGLLASAAACFGVPHPPGYPLWTLLGGLWLRLLGSMGVEPVAALSAFSAVAASLVSGAIAALARSHGATLPVAVLAGVLPSKATTFAAQAVTIEVYALAAAFQMTALAFALAPRLRPLPVALALGFGLAAHPNTLFLLPTLVALVWVRSKDRSRRSAVRFGAALLAPLALYLYVPLAARRDPAVNWGDASTWPNLLDHLLRRQYETGLERDGPALLEFLLEQSVGQLPLAFAFAGVALLPATRGGAERALAWCVVVYVVALALGFWAIRWPLNVITEARLAGSMLPLLLPLAAAVGLAVGRVERHLRNRGVSRHFRDREGPVVRARKATHWATLVGSACIYLAPAYGPETLKDQKDLSKSLGAEPYAQELLAGLPPDAVLVVHRLGASDILGFPLLFEQVVRGARPDVLLIDRGMLGAAWYRAQLARRHPYLAPILAAHEARLAASPAPSDPRSQRLAHAPILAALFDGSRPLCFTDLPGPAVLGDRELIPGNLFFEWVPEGLHSERGQARFHMGPPSLEAALPGEFPWNSVFGELLAERNAAIRELRDR